MDKSGSKENSTPSLVRKFPVGDLKHWKRWAAREADKEYKFHGQSERFRSLVYLVLKCQECLLAWESLEPSSLTKQLEMSLCKLNSSSR